MLSRDVQGPLTPSRYDRKKDISCYLLTTSIEMKHGAGLLLISTGALDQQRHPMPDGKQEQSRDHLTIWSSVKTVSGQKTVSKYTSVASAWGLPRNRAATIEAVQIETAVPQNDALLDSWKFSGEGPQHSGYSSGVTRAPTPTPAMLQKTER